MAGGGLRQTGNPVNSPIIAAPVTRPNAAGLADTRSSPVSRPRRPEHKLTVKEVLDELVADGLVERAEIDRASAGSRPADRGELHPLVVVANKQLHLLEPPHQVLSLERLTEWLAGGSGCPTCALIHSSWISLLSSDCCRSSFLRIRRPLSNSAGCRG
jgi:hypothetical protein